jgi:hypothetical protein
MMYMKFDNSSTITYVNEVKNSEQSPNFKCNQAVNF